MGKQVLLNALAGFIALVIIFFACTTAFAAESKKSLNSPARITQQAATKIALLEVPNGKIKSAELARENGKQIWLFDISQPGSADIAEIQVDAKTGAMLAKVIKTPVDQARELAAAKAKKQKTRK